MIFAVRCLSAVGRWLLFVDCSWLLVVCCLPSGV